MSTPLSDDARSQLDALVERGAPTSEFIPFFTSRREAARYLAGAYAARFQPEVGGEICAACEGRPVKRAVVYRWNAVFFEGFGFGALDALKLALGRIGVTIKKEIIGFDTTHPLCESCGKQIRNRRWIANVLNFIGLFTVIVAGVAASTCWAGMFYFDFKKASERGEWHMMTAVSTGVLLAGVMCLWVMKRLRVPPALRFLGRRPFFYQSSKMLNQTR